MSKTETVELPVGTMAAIEQVLLQMPQVRAYAMLAMGKIVDPKPDPEGE